MHILGIHDGHNSSACLLVDGQLVAAIQEERLSRIKNHGGYPEQSIREVLRITNLRQEEIDAFAFCGYTSVQKHNLLEQNLAAFDRKFRQSPKSIFHRLEKKIRKLRDFLLPHIGTQHKEARVEEKKKQREMALLQRGIPQDKIVFFEHHLCHAATAYYGQENRTDKILVLTCDGAGDGVCATVSLGEGGKIQRMAQVPRSEAVSMLYALVTYYLGFTPLEHEYKLMGMAPYAAGAKQSRKIADYLLSLFAFSSDNPLVWARSSPDLPPTYQMAGILKEALDYKRFDSVCAGLQIFTEEFMIQWIRRCIQTTGIHKLALAGGIFMNVKLNKLIADLPEVESLFVFPSCGDESTSIGAAWIAHQEQCQRENKTIPIAPIDSFYLGDAFTEDEAKKALDTYTFHKKVRVTHYDDIEKECARLVAQGNIVARCKGRMEFGARALGNRSILANPTRWETIHEINAMIKQRDFWMPFAPSMLEEYADQYIVNPKKIKAPYMILAFDSRKENVDKIVAAIHPYDKSCRPQVVAKSQNPDYHRLIGYYRELTGSGAILNTSFNLHGYPIVYKPVDALDVFDRSGLHYLALGDFLIEE